MRVIMENNPKSDKYSQAERLRKSAEKKLRKSKAKHVEGEVYGDMQKLIHELQVHQVELEMQNEELYQTRAELETSRARYFELYDLAPVAYFILSEDGLILEANLQAATMLGVARGDLVKQPLSRFILLEDQDIFYRYRKLISEVGAPPACELRLVKKDNTQPWVQVEAVSAGDIDGAPVLRVAMINITKRKQVEAKLLESEYLVRKLNKHILNMVMVLSHDIRSPLVSIASILKLMLRDSYGKLDQSLANTVRDLLYRCTNLLGTAEDYLGKASIVEGKMEIKREALDLRQDIIDVILDELADDITKNEIAIDNCLGTIPAGSISISADKTWLKSVYRNLFTNSIKYGGKGCTISFGFEQCESYYRLNVFNSGKPIPEQDRENLFVRFGRTRASGNPTKGSVGLGLSLSREIIHDHGGEIWYEAQPDGSNFVFTISREDVGGA
ncbi:MAG: ATP-binding protein, partial [Pseudomonadota bacterium]|nr:ATP-binding protein [Pseudomonadota bacterium]